jgi:hypothetical protein
MPQPLPIFDSQHFNQGNSRLNLPISQNHKSSFKVKYYEYSFSSHLTPNSYTNSPILHKLYTTLFHRTETVLRQTVITIQNNTTKCISIISASRQPQSKVGQSQRYKSNDTIQPAPIHPDVNAVKPNSFPSCLIALKCNPRGCDY